MSMTKQGGVTLVNTLVNRKMAENPGVTRDEAYELYRAEMRERSSKGGKHKHPGKGFAADPKRARIAGAIGGRISRKTKKDAVVTK